MKCKKARRLISDYIDNNLNKKKKFRVENHLKECKECSEFLKDLKEIVKKTKNLEQFHPSENLWLKIKADLMENYILETKRPNRFLRILNVPVYRFALISLIVLISGALIAFLYYEKKNKLMNQNEYVLKKIEEAEQHYKMAIKSMEQAFSLIKGNLDPEVMSEFKKNLELLDSSIQESQRAVLKEPYNFERRFYLFALYQHKINFLREIINAEKISSAEDYSLNP